MEKNFVKKYGKTEQTIINIKLGTEKKSRKENSKSSSLLLLKQKKKKYQGDQIFCSLCKNRKNLRENLEQEKLLLKERRKRQQINNVSFIKKQGKLSKTKN